MGKVLLIGEHRRDELKANAAELVAAARILGSEVDAALLGPGAEGAAAALGAYGVGTVHVLDGDVPVYSSDGFTEALAPVIEAGGYEYVVLMQSFLGRDLGARLAARLGGGFISDVTVLAAEDGQLVATKPLYAGKVIGKVAFTGGGAHVVTIRPKNFAPAEAGEPVAVTVQALAAPAAYKAKVTGVDEKEAGMIDEGDRCGTGRLARGGRRGLDRAQPPGGPDRQGGQSAALHRDGHQRGDPAPGRHADQQDHRGGQQQPGRADLQAGRLRHRRQPVRCRAGAQRAHGRGAEELALGLLAVFGSRRIISGWCTLLNGGCLIDHGEVRAADP